VEGMVSVLESVLVIDRVEFTFEEGVLYSDALFSRIVGESEHICSLALTVAAPLSRQNRA